MKRIVLLIGLLLLIGCAKQPVIANLNPFLAEQPAGIYPGGTAVFVSGQDVRKLPEVVVYMNDDPASRLTNVTAPSEVILGRLVAGLSSQGLGIVGVSSPVHLKFVINELLVRVTHQNLLYSADAKTYITLTVENRGTVFTKVFKREANSDSAGRPNLTELEAMLNSQLSDILKQILQDEEIRALISKK